MSRADVIVYGELSPTWHSTGGTRAVVLARQVCQFPRHGRVPDFLAGGPIDAPDVMPSGSMNSTTTFDPLTGRAWPAMSYCYRPGCAPWSINGDPA